MQSAVRRTVAALTLSTALIGSSAALAAPANAEKWTYQDAAGDVVRESMGTIGSEQEPAPDRANSDITKVVAVHKGRALTIKVRSRDRMTGMFATNSMIRTPHKRYYLSTMRVPGFMSTVELADPSRKRNWTVKCRGLERSFDETRTVLTLRIPRSCIGNPKWVRFSISTMSADMLSDDDYSYFDDGLREGFALFGAGKMSPKLRHG